MKPTLRTLALVTVCAALCACEEDKPAPTPKPKTPKIEQPALTAAAPTRPHSILDTPTALGPSSLAAQTPDKSATKSDELKPDAGLKAPDGELKAATLTKDPREQLEDLDCEGTGEDAHVERLVLASGVKEREPLDEADTFSTETDKIWAFVQFDNEHGAPFSVRVHWEKLDGPVSPYGYVLDVPTAKRFRTWSWTAIRREPGQYKVVLRTLDGKELASRPFEIKAPDTLATQ